MKIKELMIVAVLLTTGLTVSTAQEVTEQQALAIAREFMPEKVFASQETNSGSASADFAAVHGYYVVNAVQNGGYVIVSADERTEHAVLGYSTNGHFDYDALPANAKAWMDSYTEGIGQLKNLPVGVSRRSSKTAVTDGKKVEPLCKTKWGQFKPYNNMCPQDPTSGENSLTGCVVTATAQIMRKHQWPAQGIGTASYQWNGVTLTADLSQSIYQWDLMLDTYKNVAYTDEQGNAVALLMSDLGYASGMNYSSTDSGTSSDNMPRVLWEHFDYDKNILKLERNNCTADEFSAVLRSELDAGRPVLMGGSNIGAHAYVCDGYDERGYFHINYGWDGESDQYYLLGQNMPYSNELDILYGIQPNKNGKGCVNGQSKQDFMWKEGDELTCSLYVLSTIDFEPIEVALAAKNTATDAVQYFVMTHGEETSQLAGHVNNTQFTSFIFDKTLADGTYQLYPVCRMVGDDSWQTFYFADLRQRYVDLTVSGGKKTYANNHIDNTMEAGRVEVDGIYYLLDDQKLEASVTCRNNRYGSYKGDVVIPATVTVGDKTYQVTAIGDDAFRESHELTSVRVGANVKTINLAFYLCDKMKSITFDEGSQLETVGGYAFQNCRALEAIELPEGTKSIGIDAFTECNALTRVVIPQSVNQIFKDAFSTLSKNLHMYVAWQNPESETEIFSDILWQSGDLTTWKLHVPKGTKEKYQKLLVWSVFGTIVDDNTTAIDPVRSATSKSQNYYDLQGRQLNGKPERGMYIHNNRKFLNK